MSDTVIDWHCVHYEALSKPQLMEILALRQQVFVVEQNCAYADIDGLDETALHVSGRRAAAATPLIAYARIHAPGDRYEEVSIGRVLTHVDRRGEGLGRRVMQRAIDIAKQKWPGQPIKIGAQVHLQKFYAELGFEPISEPYDEDGIPHLDMRLNEGER